MVTKTITYEDYEGNTVTETFHFNLTKAELVELELGTEGGMAEFAQKVKETKNGKDMITLFKNMIIKAYGEFVKLPNGKSRFLKSDDMANAFAQTDAYSQLFLEIAGSDEAATKFMLGIIPSDMVKGVSDEISRQKNAEAIEVKPEVLTGVVE